MICFYVSGSLDEIKVLICCELGCRQISIGLIKEVKVKLRKSLWCTHITNFYFTFPLNRILAADMFSKLFAPLKKNLKMLRYQLTIRVHCYSISEWHRKHCSPRKTHLYYLATCHSAAVAITQTVESSFFTHSVYSMQHKFNSWE